MRKAKRTICIFLHWLKSKMARTKCYGRIENVLPDQWLHESTQWTRRTFGWRMLHKYGQGTVVVVEHLLAAPGTPVHLPPVWRHLHLQNTTYTRWTTTREKRKETNRVPSNQFCFYIHRHDVEFFCPRMGWNKIHNPNAHTKHENCTERANLDKTVVGRILFLQAILVQRLLDNVRCRVCCRQQQSFVRQIRT